MVNRDVLKGLFRAFPKAIINRLLEFVADPTPRVNSYFTVGDCETEEDVSAKLLEWLSREAYKSEHYYVDYKNTEVHEYHLRGINQFLGTNFTQEDIRVIYCELGNRADHDKTLRFIRSGYNMEVLRNG